MNWSAAFVRQLWFVCALNVPQMSMACAVVMDRLWRYKEIYDYMCSPKSSLLRNPSLRPLLRSCSDLRSYWILYESSTRCQEPAASYALTFKILWHFLTWNCWSRNHAQSLKSSCAITQVKPWNPAWQKFEFILLLYIVYLFTTISHVRQEEPAKFHKSL